MKMNYPFKYAISSDFFILILLGMIHYFNLLKIVFTIKAFILQLQFSFFYFTLKLLLKDGFMQFCFYYSSIVFVQMGINMFEAFICFVTY